jgi:drug/metabolite transporter (DMT)-like permease
VTPADAFADRAAGSPDRTMSLDSGVLLLVLLAALMHASWNALVKSGGDRLVMTTVIMVIPCLPSAMALLVLPALHPAAWPFLILSMATHLAYFVGLLGAYRHGDLSQVYPISRGSAPALVGIGAWAVAGEALSPIEGLGVLIVSGGIMSLAWRRRGRTGTGETKAIGFALLTALTIAIYLLADGMGVRRSGNALTYICWLMVLDALPLLAFTLWRRRGRIRAAFVPSLQLGVFGGVIAAISYGITIWAMGVAPMAHVVAVRETSVIFGAAIGAALLKEPFGRFRIAAAAVVAGGAVLLNLGG